MPVVRSWAEPRRRNAVPFAFDCHFPAGKHGVSRPIQKGVEQSCIIPQRPGRVFPDVIDTVPPTERASPAWMDRPIDDEILEAIAEEPSTPAGVVERVDADAYSIRSRLQILGMHHFLDADSERRLILTHRSRTFLEGEDPAGPLT